jgi:hypothetical protein
MAGELAAAVRNITNTLVSCPTESAPLRATFVLLVLCAWMFVPEYFRYANSHSRMHRASDVFAEVQRYFYENSVCGSKIAVVFPA